MTLDWKNLYGNTKQQSWFKGNLHAHCAPFSPCSGISEETLLREYRSRNYDFLSVSNHLALTEADGGELTLLPGLEWNSRVGFMPNRAVTHQDHFGIYGDPAILGRCLEQRTRAGVLQTSGGCFVVANHPNWMEHGHHGLTMLQGDGGCVHGIEIYNALVETEEGDASAVNVWDRLLAAGHRVLGVVGDDAHAVKDIGRAWIMVAAERNTPEVVMDAIRRGRFYGSTGVTLGGIERAGDVVRIGTEEDARIDAIGRAGRLLARHVGTEAAFDFRDADTPYIRFQVMDRNWCQAWTQPFFRN